MLFAIGLKIVLQGGLTFHEGMVVGIAFLAGTSFQYGLIFPEQVSEFAGGFLANGMNAGGFAAIAMTLFLRLGHRNGEPPRRRRRGGDAHLRSHR